MDLLAAVLYVLIGMLLGGLLALIVDTYYLGQRLQKAIAAKRQLQAMLRRAERRLAAAAMRERRWSHELPAATGQADLSQAPADGLRTELESTQAELGTLRDNLTRVSNYADELNEERQVLRQELAATRARVETLREYSGRLDGELRELRQRFEESCERVTAAESARKILDRELALARKKAETAGQMEITLHQTQFQLEAAESRINRLEARQASVAAQGKTEVEAVASLVLEEASDGHNEPATKREAGQEVASLAQASHRDQGSDGPAAARQRGELERVKGIGSVYARRLQEAGIHSLVDLSNQQPERVSDILGFKVEQHDRATAWIEQARTLANS